MNWSNKWPTLVAPLNIGIDLASGTDKTVLTIHKDNNSIHCEVIGDLALSYEDDGWTLFHVPTLQVCSKLVPSIIMHDEDCISSNRSKFDKCTSLACSENYNYSREALLAWMKKVQESHKGYWNSLAQLTPKNYDGMQLTKDLLLAYCLSIPVD